MSRDSRLPHSLARTDDRDRRELERHPFRWVETEVCAEVRHALSKHSTCERESLERAEHRLVGEIDDDVGAMARNGCLDIALDGNAVVRPFSKLLRTADENRRGKLLLAVKR
jgi:hypothetical protein